MTPTPASSRPGIPVRRTADRHRGRRLRQRGRTLLLPRTAALERRSRAVPLSLAVLSGRVGGADGRTSLFGSEPDRHACRSKLRLAAKTLSDLIVLAHAWRVLVWYGIKLVDLLHHQRSPAIDLPVYYVYAALPIVSALMAVVDRLSDRQSVARRSGARAGSAEYRRPARSHLKHDQTPCPHPIVRECAVAGGTR